MKLHTYQCYHEQTHMYQANRFINDLWCFQCAMAGTECGMRYLGMQERMENVAQEGDDATQ